MVRTAQWRFSEVLVRQTPIWVALAVAAIAAVVSGLLTASVMDRSSESTSITGIVDSSTPGELCLNHGGAVECYATVGMVDFAPGDRIAVLVEDVLIGHGTATTPTVVRVLP